MSRFSSLGSLSSEGRGDSEGVKCLPGVCRRTLHTSLQAGPIVKLEKDSLTPDPIIRVSYSSVSPRSLGHKSPLGPFFFFFF